MKKILIDARLYGLEHAGLGRYTLNLVKHISDLDKQNKYVILLRKNYFERLKLPDNWEKVLADIRHYSIYEQIKILEIIRKYNPDLVHFLHFNVPVFFKGIFIVTIHDLLMHKSRGPATTNLPQHKYLIKRLGYRFVFNHAVKYATKIIVPSEYVKKEIVDYYRLDAERIIVTYEGIPEFTNLGIIRLSVSKFLRKYNLQKPYFLYIGNAYPHKNLERAIEAVVLINKKSKKKVQLVIASARDVFTNKLNKTINELHAEIYVKLIGFIPDIELETLLCEAEAFVYPTLSEGFGLQGLESISAGTLVVASDIPVFREIYKDNLIYFNPYDFTSIAQSMDYVLKMDIKERQKIITKSQKFIKRYSWTKMVKETLRVYDSVLNL